MNFNPRFFTGAGIAGILTSILMLSSCTPTEYNTTVRLNFNDGWQFIRDADSAAVFNVPNAWESVKIPHTPRIESLVVNDQWQGICWYRKRFVPEDAWQNKKLFIKFEGAMNEAEVWVNGTKKIRHLGGYLPFVIDVTEDLLPLDTNELVVRLNNRDNPVTGPKPLEILDFNMYGGIYRDVFLLIKNKVYMTDPFLDDVPAGGGVFVRFPEIDKQYAVIQITTHVINTSSGPKEIFLEHQLWRGDSVVKTERSKVRSLTPGPSRSFDTMLHLDQPALWTPSSPNLYNLVTNIRQGRSVIDTDTTRIGIKRMAFRDNAFFLNGKKTFLRGVNRHQEYPFIGYALSNEAQYRDAVKIKEAGFDYIRLSHYPHDPAFMDACDELGLLVIDAILGWQYYSDDPAFQQQIYHTSRNLVRRDRNHACVLAWEVSLNESWMPEYFIDSLHAIAHREYPGDQCFTAGWQPYGYDIYLQARQHRLNHYEPPEKPYVVSEYGDWEYYAMNAGLSQDAWQDLQPADRSSRQLLSAGEKRLLQQATNVQEAHNDNRNTPAFADGYWAMFDYNRGYADDLESSGIMSIHRLPKFSYHFLRSQRDASETSGLYNSGPMVFIASYWNENSATDVRVFSNCDEIELMLNDSLIARQRPDSGRISTHLDHPPFTFSLDHHQPGALKATAYLNGKPSAEHVVRTPGIPTDLRLKMDQSRRPPKAGVKDVLFVYAELVDKNGAVVPVNDVEVTFSVNGSAFLAGPDKVLTEAGIASVLLLIGNVPGVISIHAAASGQIAANMKIISQ